MLEIKKKATNTLTDKLQIVSDKLRLGLLAFIINKIQVFSNEESERNFRLGV